MGASVNPVVELTENDGTYILKTNSPFKSSEIKFKLGEEFEEETPDGRKVKSVCTLEGNKLLHVQKGEKETTIEREFTPTEMKAVNIISFPFKSVVIFASSKLNYDRRRFYALLCSVSA